MLLLSRKSEDQFAGTVDKAKGVGSTESHDWRVDPCLMKEADSCRRSDLV